jgi:hypothetical protein
MLLPTGKEAVSKDALAMRILVKGGVVQKVPWAQCSSLERARGCAGRPFREPFGTGGTSRKGFLHNPT